MLSTSPLAFLALLPAAVLAANSSSLSTVCSSSPSLSTNASITTVYSSSSSPIAYANATSTQPSTKSTYAACAASNLISRDPVDGKLISDVENASPYSPSPVYRPDLATAYDCCAACIDEPTCAYSYFAQVPLAYDEHYDPDTDYIDYYYSQCAMVLINTASETCNATAEYGIYYRDDAPSNNYTVSNGNCGSVGRYIQPRCAQTKGGSYACDVGCNGTSVVVPRPTTSMPACPYASL